jgi:hypothetical protein
MSVAVKQLIVQPTFIAVKANDATELDQEKKG